MEHVSSIARNACKGSMITLKEYSDTDQESTQVNSVLATIFRAISLRCPSFAETRIDYEVWRAALGKSGCTSRLMIEKTTAKIVEWPYKNPPNVHNFIDWYGKSAMESAGVADLDDVMDEVFECAMMQRTVDSLSPGGYWVWRHANRVMGKTLKECTHKEIEKQVTRYYKKLVREVVKFGPCVLNPPPKLISGNSYDVVAEQKKGASKRPKGWKSSDAYRHGVSEMDKIKRNLG